MRRLSQIMCVDEAEAALLTGTALDDLPVVLGNTGVLYFGLALADWESNEEVLHAGILWRMEGAPQRGQLLLARPVDAADALAKLFAARLRDRRPTC